MNKVSGLICNNETKVEYLIKDGQCLFDDNNADSLYEIMDEGSNEKLSYFVKAIKDEKSIVNWEMNVIKDGEIETLFFSGLFLVDKYFIQVSSERSELFFYPQKLNQYDGDDEISNDEQEEATTNDKFNDISRLNNELINIQRELTKKNLQYEQLNERLEILATTDPLTGIYNRRAILNRAKAELERASREGQIFTLAILDLNDFKGINDTYGHQAGDKALKIFAECLQKSTRNYDAAGRIGGDEFLIYFSLNDSHQFSEILARLSSQIRNATVEVKKDRTLNMNASIGGVYIKPEDASETDIEALMSQADQALYQAKNKEDKDIIITQI